MNSKPLITLGSIVVAVILVARFSKLHHLFAERSQLRLAIFLTSCAVVVVLLAVIGVITFWRLAGQEKEEAAMADIAAGTFISPTLDARLAAAGFRIIED